MIDGFCCCAPAGPVCCAVLGLWALDGVEGNTALGGRDVGAVTKRQYWLPLFYMICTTILCRRLGGLLLVEALRRIYGDCVVATDSGALLTSLSRS